MSEEADVYGNFSSKNEDMQRFDHQMSALMQFTVKNKLLIRDLIRENPENYYLMTKFRLEEIYSTSYVWAEINSQHEGI